MITLKTNDEDLILRLVYCQRKKCSFGFEGKHYNVEEIHLPDEGVEFKPTNNRRAIALLSEF